MRRSSNGRTRQFGGGSPAASMGRMSMRTTLSGCTLPKIRHLIGTADDSLIDSIRARVEQDVRGNLGLADDEEVTLEAGERDTLAAILDTLRGRPSPRPEDEGHMGYLVATALREHVDGEEPFRTDFEVKHFFWDDLLEQGAAALGDDAVLFGYLVNGRPFFGQTINNECIYAGLSRDEAIRLRDAAKRIAALPDIDEEFVEILTDPDEGLAPCIDAILAAGHDVWAETT